MSLKKIQFMFHKVLLSGLVGAIVTYGLYIFNSSLETGIKEPVLVAFSKG